MEPRIDTNASVGIYVRSISNLDIGAGFVKLRNMKNISPDQYFSSCNSN